MTITRVAGNGGLPMINVSNDHADAVISVYAGQVLSFTPKGAADVLFVSDKAYYAEGKAIKGGVPICWPWFGADPEGKGRPAHGFMRNRMWSEWETRDNADGSTTVILGVESSPETLAIWPHAFRLAMEITVGKTLQLALVTRNTGDAAFTITQAMHTYFAVGDIAQTTVTGLEGTQYLDKAADGNGATKQHKDQRNCRILPTDEKSNRQGEQADRQRAQQMRLHQLRKFSGGCFV